MMGIISGALSYAITGKLFLESFIVYTRRFWETIQTLGWDPNDNLAIEIGTSAMKLMEQELNGHFKEPASIMDAFIVIKILDRNPTVPSQPNLNEATS